ncbi:kinase-like protein [Daldinia vernicosa]|uniref:kinase-like protein n=1 Tax=Daldinia vernicosa TaxID=114800 RepID=UPI0020076D54|nr:kinase-like protein [Daldinia vernicosa]KAI0847770.1 kinase-like protein [Daldinia vernicosa]
MIRPIAQISCWIVEDSSKEYKPPEGFYVNQLQGGQGGKPSRRNTELFLDLPLIPGRAINIGRDHHVNEISINHPNVSRKHFVIYSVIYDLNDIQKQPCLIYVRDCQSLAGTYINEICIGNKEKGATRGFYISRDVEVTIKPYWKFRISLLDHNTELKSPLNSIQLKESTLFQDRYIITDRTLGRGAFAKIHLAVDARTGKQLACKIHDLDRLRRLAPSHDLIRRIKDETDILGKLRHPNLPVFEYAFHSAHTLYTFIELATGGDLFSMRLTRGTFDEQDCKFVIRQVINAICYLHKGGIAHRDLKPENIFFATGPDLTGRVIVGDLGFAKSTASGRMASRVGTDQYMAPEVEYGGTHGLAVDIWSLGMIVVFLLAPDENAVPSSIMKINQAAITGWLDSVFEDPSQQRISNSCQQFIRSCLMFEPGRRLKASEAKHHSWFQQQPDKQQFKFLMKENIETWKPAHTIAPPIQELPDIQQICSTVHQEGQDRASYSSTPSANLGKRASIDTTADGSNPQASPHFTYPGPVGPKRLKMTGLGA